MKQIHYLLSHLSKTNLKLGENLKRSSVAIILRISSPKNIFKFNSPSSKADLLKSVNYIKEGELEVIYIKRSVNIRDRWSGQVSFPGGKKDEVDSDDYDTACRETFEEIGLDLKDQKSFLYLGHLQDRYVFTRFGGKKIMAISVEVFMQICNKTPKTSRNKSEVNDIIWTNLNDLIKQKGDNKQKIILRSVDLFSEEFKQKAFKFVYGDLYMPAYTIQNKNRDNKYKLWGLTLYITSYLMEKMNLKMGLLELEYPIFRFSKSIEVNIYLKLISLFHGITKTQNSLKSIL